MLKEFFIINMVEKSAEKLITHAAKTSFNKNKSNNSQDSQQSVTYNTYNTEIYNENPVAGSKTVSLVCAHCGGTMTVDKDSSILKCPYCGSAELIRENDNVKIAKIKNDTQKEIEIKKMEYEDRERERRYKERRNESDDEFAKFGMYLLVPLVLFFLIFALIQSSKKDEVIQPLDPTMAAVSMSSSSFDSENYQSALNLLQKSGFTNITCEPVYDIYFGVLSSEGNVAKISINGITDFDKNETFPKDAEIIITYHLNYKDAPDYTEETTIDQSDIDDTRLQKNDFNENTVTVSEETVTVLKDFDKITMPSSAYEYKYKNYQDVISDLNKLGFTNIKTEVVYDIYFGILVSEGESDKVTIDGNSNFEKGDTFSKDAEIVVTFHLNYTEDPTYTGTATNKTTNTQSTTTESKSLFYSTNDNDTAKDGNTGVFSYKSNGGQYSIYYIIDFDEGYVYRFIEGNGDETCERLKIDSGDLNNGIIVTYHDGNDTWSNGLHFETQRIPANLVLEDNFGFETEFDCTNLKEALRIKDKKKIIDY